MPLSYSLAGAILSAGHTSNHCSQTQLLWTMWGHAQGVIPRGERKLELLSMTNMLHWPKSQIYFALQNCHCFRPKWNLPRSGTNYTTSKVCAMGGLGNGWLWGRRRSERTQPEIRAYFGKKIPSPQHSNNNSPSAQLSKDHFSPLKWWWVDQHWKTCVLPAVWLKLSQRTSYCPLPSCLLLVK